MQKYYIFAALAILCLISVSIGTFMMTRKNEKTYVPTKIITPPPVTSLPVSTTTIPPAEPKEPSMSMEVDDDDKKRIHNTIVVYDALGRPYYPTMYEKFRYGVHPRNHPHYYYPSPLEPGGAFPDLVGMNKDKAVAYVLQTYPNLHVATVRYGQALPKDVRMDRMVIVYDTWTNLVIEAHIS